MKKLLRSFLDDILWYLLGFIPVILIVIFGMVAVTFWEEYALKSIAIFTVIVLVVYFYFVKSRKK